MSDIESVLTPPSTAWSQLEMEKESFQEKRLLIVGGGLVGSLAAIVFAQKGWLVTVAEKRADPRKQQVEAGRSINLALSERGISALKLVKLDDFILSRCYPMKARMIHKLPNIEEEQLYGLNGEVINSVDRKMLNIELLNKAEETGKVTILFEYDCLTIDFDRTTAVFESRGDEVTLCADLIIGADGAYSQVRKQLMKKIRMDYSQTYIERGYKELLLPASSTGAPLLSVNHLHIWPHHDFMLIALPNQDNSFTCTLFFPFELFNALDASDAYLVQFFEKNFPDFTRLIGKKMLLDEYKNHQTSSLISLKCNPFHYKDKCVLLGDAIHAMVPFYGQGMNCGFEDVHVLSDLLTNFAETHTLERILTVFTQIRKPQVDSMIQLAMENYWEMSSHVLSPYYKFKKGAIALLSRVFPQTFLPQYTMVSFTNIPYDEVIRRRDRQNQIFSTSVVSIAVATVALISFKLCKAAVSQF